MNKTDSLSERSCHSIVFSNDAKEMSYGILETGSVLIFPLDLSESAGKDKIIAPENAAEAKEIAKNAEELKKQGYKISTKEVAEKRIKRNRKVVRGPLIKSDKVNKTIQRNEDDSSR